jgi:hypothetical protein
MSHPGINENNYVTLRFTNDFILPIGYMGIAAIDALRAFTGLSLRIAIPMPILDHAEFYPLIHIFI